MNPESTGDPADTLAASLESIDDARLVTNRKLSLLRATAALSTFQHHVAHVVSLGS
jgi:hypothetical protein